MILLYDSCSVGYDYRDFELVLDFIKSKPNNQFLIYTDERNVSIFANSAPNYVCFEGYPKRLFSKERLQELVEEYCIDFDKIFCFSDLYSKVVDRDKLPSEFLKPNSNPYLSSSEQLVKNYKDFLDKLASHHNYIVVFAIVSGFKPLSDVGRTLDEQKLEGYRQTYPFEEIAEVLKFVQDSLLNKGIAVVPISAQYGEPNEIELLLEKVSQDKGLKFPIKTLRDIDWSDKPEQQAAFFKAIHERACNLRIPSVSFGNASTYQHLIIAATGGFHMSAVALDSYYKDISKDGRPYWRDLGNGGLPGLKVFQQKLDEPGNWKPVTQAMQKYLQESILSWI
jgi:hypothetical protein